MHWLLTLSKLLKLSELWVLFIKNVIIQTVGMKNKPVIAQKSGWEWIMAKGSIRVMEKFCVVIVIVTTGLCALVKTNITVH